MAEVPGSPSFLRLRCSVCRGQVRAHRLSPGVWGPSLRCAGCAPPERVLSEACVYVPAHVLPPAHVTPEFRGHAVAICVPARG